MPAVDYHLPGGLTWAELTAVLRTASPASRPPASTSRSSTPPWIPTVGLRTLVDALVAGLTP